MKLSCQVIPKGRIMAAANVAEFTEQNWDQEVAKSGIPVLVDFWAPWCGPCRALAPAIDRVAAQFEGKIKVGKLNVDDAQDLAAKYRVTNIPRVLIFKGSDQPVKTIVGLVSEAELVRNINSVLEG
jgi:thioredoxin 1